MIERPVSVRLFTKRYKCIPFGRRTFGLHMHCYNRHQKADDANQNISENRELYLINEDIYVVGSCLENTRRGISKAFSNEQPFRYLGVYSVLVYIQYINAL